MMKHFFLFVLSLFFLGLYSIGHADFLDYEQIPDWGNHPIDVLVNHDILSGNDDGTFAPDRSMNRVEFCKVVVNATGVTKYLPLQSHFPDIERGDWFFDFVETAKQYGWVTGYPDGYFKPAGKINRAEVAKILSIAFGLEVPPIKIGQEWSDPYFEALQQAGLLAHGTSFSNLGAGETPSRAEIAEQIYRFMVYTGKFSPYDLMPQEAETETEDQGAVQLGEEEQTEDTTTEDTGIPSQPITDNPTYQYTKTLRSSLPISSDAGSLYVEKSDTLLKRIDVSRARKNVLVHALKIRAEEGPVEIAGFNFRRMGSGNAAHFQTAWIEVDGEKVSKKVLILTDLFYIPLSNTLVVEEGTQEEIVLRVDMGYSFSEDKSSRFVLYRPDWIDADTDAKIGFFPIGGTDVFMK